MVFKTDERVLCFHGPLLYEAKVLRSRVEVAASEVEEAEGEHKKTKDGKPLPSSSSNNKELSHLVHYKGWKRTWDEWVKEDRMRKWTEENLKHSKELKMEALAAQKRISDAQAHKKNTATATTHSSSTAAAAAAATTSASANGRENASGMADREAATTTPAARGQKRTRETVESERDGLLKPNLQLHIPDILKARLVDDWEWITKDQRLVPIPKPGDVSVSQILQDYRLSIPMKRPGSAEADIFEECMAGLQTYFDKTLGTILLYRFERQQYADLRKKHGDDAKMSDYYGAEHLLRLFVSMQELVTQTQMDPQAVLILRGYLQDIMKYMIQHMDYLFVKEYDVTAPSYSRMLNLS